MSEKAKTVSKWTKLGNYMVGYEKNSLGTWLCVKSLNGLWNIRWADGTYIYVVFGNLLNDEKSHGYLEGLLTLFYVATTYPHDLAAVCETKKTPFFDGFGRLIQEQADLEATFAPKATDEEDEEALNQVVEMDNLREQMIKEAKERKERDGEE